jgi:hypothetical protein
MTQLLVLGAAILATGPLTIADGEVRAPDAIFPLQAISGWQVVDADLPSGFTPAEYAWDGGLTRKASTLPMPTEREYVAAVQAVLDAKAQERRYYDMLSASTYATSTNATFKAEALACLAWRDAVWAKAYSLLDEVQAGHIAQPTIPELLAMLPTMEWPDV